MYTWGIGYRSLLRYQNLWMLNSLMWLGIELSTVCSHRFCIHVLGCSVVSELAAPWTIAFQAPLLMEFFRHRFLSGVSFPTPKDLPHQGIKPVSLVSPALAGRFFAIGTTREATASIDSTYASWNSVPSYLNPWMQSLQIQKTYWTFMEKILHINGPSQFKPMLFSGQVHLIFSSLYGWRKLWVLHARKNEH